MTESPPRLPDVGEILRAIWAWTAALSAMAAALAWWLVGSDWALGIALGALIGAGNIMLLARALAVVVSNAARHRPGRPGGWSLPIILLLKWPLVLLALAFVLWYMPARPEGVAIGLILSLAGAATAASRRRRT